MKNNEIDKRKIEYLVIPDGTKEILAGEYKDYIDLKSVVIPSSVISIGDYAFYGCTSLSSVKISDGVKSIDSRAFAICTSLTKITIPTSVTIIRDEAFYGCNNLINIEIPSSVTYIGKNAFYGCEKLNGMKNGFINLNGKEYQVKKEKNTGAKIDAIEKSKLYEVECKNGNISVTKLFSNMQDIDDKGTLLYNLEYIFGYSGFCSKSITEIIEYVLKKRNTLLCDNVIIDEDRKYFKYTNDFELRIPGTDYFYHCNMISKEEKKASIENFYDDLCVGLTYSRDLSGGYFSMGVFKVDKVFKENLWEDYEYENEDLYYSYYFKDENNRVYLLVFSIQVFG